MGFRRLCPSATLARVGNAETAAEAWLASEGDVVVSARGVSKAWGDNLALHDISVDVVGGITGLLGPNGAGKTTFFGMVLGLHEPTSGELLVLGKNPQSAGLALRMRIGYSPEHANLPPDMAAQDFVRHMAEFHGLPRRDATTRSSDALWMVGLGEERARPVGTMSTGQRQRVKLAQAIAHDPLLVLLDEPTDGLDPVQRDEMLKLIRRVGTEFGINIILSSHLLEEVERVADNAIIINNGTVVKAGPIGAMKGTDSSGLIVDLDSNTEAISAALAAVGCSVTVDGRRLLVDGPKDLDGLLDAVRDAAADTGASIRRIKAQETSLEDLFLEQINAGAGAV